MLFKEAEKILKTHKEELAELGAKSLAIFGSVATNQSHEKSDVDILVEFEVKKGLFAFVHLRDYLEGILHCDVDLVTEQGLRPAFKEKVLSEARKIY